MSDLIRLFHTTPRRNVASIFAHGLLPHLATGPHQLVWLHQHGLCSWARGHVAHRHQVRPAEVAVLEVRLPVEAVKLFRGGLYTSARRIPPQCIFGINRIRIAS